MTEGPAGGGDPRVRRTAQRSTRRRRRAACLQVALDQRPWRGPGGPGAGQQQLVLVGAQHAHALDILQVLRVSLGLVRGGAHALPHRGGCCAPSRGVAGGVGARGLCSPGRRRGLQVLLRVLDGALQRVDALPQVLVATQLPIQLLRQLRHLRRAGGRAGAGGRVGRAVGPGGGGQQAQPPAAPATPEGAALSGCCAECHHQINAVVMTPGVRPCLTGVCAVRCAPHSHLLPQLGQRLLLSGLPASASFPAAGALVSRHPDSVGDRTGLPGLRAGWERHPLPSRTAWTPNIPPPSLRLQ